MLANDGLRSFGSAGRLRIVAVADTHLFHDDLKVPDGDIFVHAGDMCRGGELEELEDVARWILALPHRAKIIVAGNHDWAFVRESRAARELFATATYLEDSGSTVAGLRFWGTPWQPAYNDWAFNLPRGEALAAKWRLIPEGTDVLITHGPPAGIGDASSIGRARSGCADLRDRVAVLRPRLHLFGHTHEGGGVWQIDGVTYANCTTWECEQPPTVLDIDPTDGAVTIVA